MRWLLLVYLLSICMVASSGKQRQTEPQRDRVMDSLKARIDQKADSVAILAADKIDSLYSVSRIIEGRRDIIPAAPTGRHKPWKKGFIQIWLYKIRGKDTSYFNKRIIPLQ